MGNSTCLLGAEMTKGTITMKEKAKTPARLPKDGDCIDGRIEVSDAGRGLAENGKGEFFFVEGSS